MHLWALVWCSASALIVPRVTRHRQRFGATAYSEEALAFIEEKAALDLARSLETVELASSSTVFVRTAVAPSRSPPLILVHGFDSSALEFRRLMPALEARGVEAYALDVLGWGLTVPKAGVTVAEKRAQLGEFMDAVIGKGRKVTLVGASLGGAICIDSFCDDSARVESIALIDPQCLIDGTPPVPRPLARWGVRVLASWPLRSAANRMAYADKSLATDDAIRVGLLHTKRVGWEDDAIEWLLGGGYSVSSQVSKLRETPTLVLWGEDDGILPPADNLPRLGELLPDALVQIVADCGHVPHLEQPEQTADALAAFVSTGRVEGVVAAASAWPPARAAAPAAASLFVATASDDAPPRAYDWTILSRGPPPRRSPPRPTADDDVVTVRWGSPLTIAGLLFFVPLFSSELFFAISRQFICSSRQLALADLCTPIISPNASP